VSAIAERLVNSYLPPISAVLFSLEIIIIIIISKAHPESMGQAGGGKPH